VVVQTWLCLLFKKRRPGMYCLLNYSDLLTMRYQRETHPQCTSFREELNSAYHEGDSDHVLRYAPQTLQIRGEMWTLSHVSLYTFLEIFNLMTTDNP